MGVIEELYNLALEMFKTVLNQVAVDKVCLYTRVEI